MTTATELTELADLIELGKRDFKALTQRQKEDLLSEASRLEDVGDEDGADDIYRLFPLPAEYVKGIKNDFGEFGTEMLKELNYNYSEAEAVYGKDWLDR